MLISELYEDVCDTLLEPGGFQLGLVTEAQFLQYYRAVMEEFLGKTSLIKGLAIVSQMYGQAEYTQPDWISGLEAVCSDGATTNLDYEDSIAARDINWQRRIGNPRSWRQDKTDMKTLFLFPAPVVESSQMPSPPAAPDYGSISAYVPGGSTSGVQAFVGTMTQADKTNTYASPGNFFGTTDLNQFSRGNVAMIGTLGLFNEEVSLSDTIEHITDDMAIFIKYGILRKIFACDGEMRDVLRERYCKARYDEGIMLATTIMGEEVEAES